MSDDDKQRIIDFYTSDKYSRHLPGMKNVKSVKQPNGKRLKIQKRLLIVNVDELHSDYKKKYKNINGIFADLRQKHVVRFDTGVRQRC